MTWEAAASASLLSAHEGRARVRNPPVNSGHAYSSVVRKSFDAASFSLPRSLPAGLDKGYVVLPREIRSASEYDAKAFGALACNLPSLLETVCSAAVLRPCPLGT